MALFDYNYSMYAWNNDLYYQAVLDQDTIKIETNVGVSEEFIKFVSGSSNRDCPSTISISDASKWGLVTSRVRLKGEKCTPNITCLLYTSPSPRD